MSGVLPKSAHRMPAFSLTSWLVLVTVAASLIACSVSPSHNEEARRAEQPARPIAVEDSVAKPIVEAPAPMRFVDHLAHRVPAVLTQRSEEILQTFGDNPPNKAVAFSPNGRSGYTWAASSFDWALRAALQSCQDAHGTRCYPYRVNDTNVLLEHERFVAESTRARASVVAPLVKPYANEDKDSGVAARTEMRRLAEGFEAPTPVEAPGAMTVTTSRLVELLRTGNLVVINAGGWDQADTSTIPFAFHIDWIGWEDAPGVKVTSKQLEDRLRMIMDQAVPDRATPIVVFCHNVDCWDSYNSVLRLRKLGYVELYWYRGGIASWRAAGLPTVAGVFHSTIYTPAKSPDKRSNRRRVMAAVVPGAGLWRFETSGTFSNQRLHYCSDGVNEPNFFGIDRDSMLDGMDCTEPAEEKRRRVAIFRSTCTLDDVSASTEARVAGDLRSAFSLAVTTRVSENLVASRRLHFNIKATRLGECGPDQRPGDLIMPDGAVIRNNN